MKLLNYALAVVFALGVMSCGGGGDDADDLDKTNPTVSVSSPTAGVVVKATENLSVSVKVSDNVALKKYKLTVSSAGVKTGIKMLEEFKFDSDSDKTATGGALPAISGKSAVISFPMLITEKAKSGEYLFKIVVTDTSGNSTTKSVKFTIKNEG